MASNKDDNPISYHEFNELSMEKKKWHARSKGMNVADIEAELQLADAMHISSTIDNTGAAASQTLSLSSHADLIKTSEEVVDDDNDDEEERVSSSSSTSSTLSSSDDRHLLLNHENSPHKDKDDDEEEDSLLYDEAFVNPAISLKLDKTVSTLANNINTSKKNGNNDEAAAEEEEEEQVKECYFERLPSELTGSILGFLDGDSLGYSFQIHRRFCFNLNENQIQGCFQRLCELTYLSQSRHKKVNPIKWGGWKQMYMKRNRVRTNGFYCFLTEWTKSVTHDMWGNIDPNIHSLKCQSFRYLRFLSNGKVLYCLTHHPPEKMTKYLFSVSNKTSSSSSSSNHHKNVVREGSKEPPPDICVGTYSLENQNVFTAVRSHFNVVRFKLKLSNGIQGGHFTRLEVISHTSRANSIPVSQPACHHRETIGYSFFFLRAYP